ncbi:MAG: hypothetical protein LBF62_07005 [Tannerellaceae bacterium]|jgi:hypothetical protein|nr:hypothetical protein [Tannerellaceae bacterium]
MTENNSFISGERESKTSSIFITHAFLLIQHGFFQGTLLRPSAYKSIYARFGNKELKFPIPPQTPIKAQGSEKLFVS